MTLSDSGKKFTLYPNISVQGALLLLALIIMGIVGVGYVIFEQYKKSITESEIQDLGTIADNKVAQILAWRDSHIQRAEFYLTGALFPGEIEKWLHDGAHEGKHKQKIMNVLHSLQEEKGYKSILLLDKNGVVRGTTNDSYVPEAMEKELAAEAMRSKKVMFSDLHRGIHDDNRISIDFVAPLIVLDDRKNTHVVGALLFEIDPYLFLYPKIQSWPTHSTSAETVLVERDGDYIVYLNELRHQKNTALSLRFPLSHSQLTAVKAVLGQTEVVEAVDYRGVPVVAALRSIPDTPWFISAEIDEAELFAPIHQLKKWTAGLGFVFIALAGGLFYFWYRGAQASYQELKGLHDAAVEREFLVKHFEYLTRYANDMIIVSDETGEITEANEKAEQALGYSREELLQMHVGDLHDVIDRADIPGKIEVLNRSGELRFEGYYLRKDGRVFPVEINVRMIRVEGNKYMQAIVRDITERKAAEILICTSEAALAEFKYTLDQTLDSVFIFQADTLRYTYVNEGAKAQVGYSEAELLRMTPVDIKPCMTDKSFRSMLQPLLDGSIAAHKYETLHRHKDGHDIHVEINMQLVRKAGLEPRFVTVVRDISEQKRIEVALIEAKELAEQANRAKSEFLSRMSHELRTPLNSIIGFAQIMEVSAYDETIGAHRDNIKTIIRSGWHLLSIIQDLLNLSAIEAKKIELNIENVDIRGCMKECMELMEPLAGQKMIELKCIDDACGGVMVRADAFRLKQVVINLLANAVKFNKVGGRVTVSARRTVGRIRIMISDTGTGISGDDLASLFEPFSQLSKRPYSIEGAGIGLSIAKQLIELMGGKIGVESIYYLGSKFWIELPVAEGEITVSKPAVLKEQSVASDNDALLLYIEDSPDHVFLMKEIISRMDNISLLTAHTPTLGLDMARVRKPDIILLDICLPGMNGYEVLKLLQSNELTRSIPVMAVSASAGPAEIEKGLRAGFRRYLTKPINVIEFKSAVEELLRDKLIV